MYTKLSIGNSGNEVKRLKSMLKSLSYAISDEDEHFDERTRIAVLSFQNDSGIKINGIADEKTWTALFNAAPSIPSGSAVAGLTLAETADKADNSEMPEKSDKTEIAGIVEKSDKDEGEKAKKAEMSNKLAEKSDDAVAGNKENLDQGATKEKQGDQDAAEGVKKDASADAIAKKDGKKDAIFEKDAKNANSSETPKNGGVAEENVGFINIADCDAVPGNNYEPVFNPDKYGYVRPLIDPEMTDYIDSVISREDDLPDANPPGYAFTPGYTESDSEGMYASVYDDPYLTPENGNDDAAAHFGISRTGNAFEELSFIPINGEGNSSSNYGSVFRDEKAGGTLDKDTYPGYGSLLSPTWGEPTLRLGSVGESVMNLQRKLQTHGFFYGSMDGIFGRDTENAVKAFQSSKMLVPDGIVGNLTWNAINAAPSRTPSVPGGESRPVLREGSGGTYVFELQTALRDMGYYGGKIDGIFSSITANAVRQFQRANGLVPDAIVGSLTWAALGRAYTQPQQGRSTLREGDRGEYVVELQKKLNLLGYYMGAVDGIYGRLTYKAVYDFQATNGLMADGVVCAKTWAAIDAALSAVPAPGKGWRFPEKQF